MTTGMTKAERWYEVARRVWGGAFFGDAVDGVFDDNAANVIGDEGWTNWDCNNDDEYDTYYGMLALFLSYEAEDEEGERLLIEHLIDSNCIARTGEHGGTLAGRPEPVTMVAAEEPVVPVSNHTSGSYVSTAQYVGAHGSVSWVGDKYAERRSAWNKKLADGMRKWAHWLEERF